MKKLFSMLVLATFLLAGGYVHAIAIPSGESAAEGPAQWIVPVYNNSGAALDAGDVVVWDIGSSTGDNDNYVTTTTTGDTSLVAGVVLSDIAIGSYGNIVTHGTVSVDVQGGLNVVGGLACTGTAAGTARSCQTSANTNSFGIVTAVSDGTNATVFVRGLN